MTVAYDSILNIFSENYEKYFLNYQRKIIGPILSENTNFLFTWNVATIRDKICGQTDPNRENIKCSYSLPHYQCFDGGMSCVQSKH